VKGKVLRALTGQGVAFHGQTETFSSWNEFIEDRTLIEVMCLEARRKRSAQRTIRPRHKLLGCPGQSRGIGGSSCGLERRLRGAFFYGTYGRTADAGLGQKEGRGFERRARRVWIIGARYLAGRGREGRRRRERLGEIVDEVWAQKSCKVEPLQRFDRLRNNRKPRWRRHKRCAGFRERQFGGPEFLCD